MIDKPFPCRPIHTFSCPCLFDRKTTRPHSRASVQKILDKYLRGLERVVNSGRYDGKKDFTVVLQPFTINARLPKARSGGLDLRFLSPDCFHWGQRTHAAGKLLNLTKKMYTVNAPRILSQLHDPCGTTCWSRLAIRPPPL